MSNYYCKCNRSDICNRPPKGPGPHCIHAGIHVYTDKHCDNHHCDKVSGLVACIPVTDEEAGLRVDDV